jgi:hypothetical protein
MSEQEQIVIGRMLDSQKIRSGRSVVELGDWEGRAAWSFLRLQFGRSIDTEIKAYVDAMQAAHGKPFNKAQRRVQVMRFFEQKISCIKDPREIQFILDSGSNVMAVASLKHLLVPEAQVYEMVDQIISRDYPKLKNCAVNGLRGCQYLLSSVAGFKLGLQVFGGSINTREAITVSSWLRVETCFNPLSWLGIGSLGSFTGRASRDYERVLRIKVISELEPRLKQGIQAAVDKTETLKGRVEAVKKISVKRSDAEIILSAMGLSYTLGEKTIDQLLDRLQQEDKTQWGISMAASWVAAHGKFKATPEGQDRSVEQKVSTIAGATLLLDDIKEARARSLEWLQAHVSEGQVQRIDDLLKKIARKKEK